MRLSTKLYGTVGALALIAILIAGASFRSVQTMGEELNVATGKTAVKLDLINAARARSWEMVSALRGAYAAASVKNQPLLEQRARQWDAAFKRSGEQIREIRPLLETPETNRDLARFDSALTEFNGVSGSYFDLCRNGRLPEAATLAPKVDAFADLADEVFTGMKLVERKALKDAQTRSDSLRSYSLLVNIVLSCLLLPIVVLAVVGMRGLSLSLLGVVRSLSEGAGQVAAAAKQVASSSQSLAQGASQQAAPSRRPPPPASKSIPWPTRTARTPARRRPW